MTDPTPDEDFAAWLAERLTDEAPPDILPTTRGVDRATAERLLAANGQEVTVTDRRIILDPDGVPIGVETITSQATLAVSGAALGWPDLDDEDGAA